MSRKQRLLLLLMLVVKEWEILLLPHALSSQCADDLNWAKQSKWCGSRRQGWEECADKHPSNQRVSCKYVCFMRCLHLTVCTWWWWWCCLLSCRCNKQQPHFALTTQPQSKRVIKIKQQQQRRANQMDEGKLLLLLLLLLLPGKLSRSISIVRASLSLFIVSYI